MTLNIKPREFEFEYNCDHSKEWVTLIKLPSDVHAGDRCKTVDRESFDRVVSALEKCVEQRDSAESNYRLSKGYDCEQLKLIIEDRNLELQAILGGGG